MIKYPWKRLSNDCATGGLVKIIETPNVKRKWIKEKMRRLLPLYEMTVSILSDTSLWPFIKHHITHSISVSYISIRLALALAIHSLG